MHDCVDELVDGVNWEMRTLMRTARFYSDAEMVNLYKSQILSYVEYRTAAIYHTCESSIQRLDRVQERFLEKIGLPVDAALHEFNLAPLHSRRDIAMLGVIHRSALGRGARQFYEFFFPKLMPEVKRARLHAGRRGPNQTQA